MPNPQDYGFIGVNHLSDMTTYQDFRDFLGVQGVFFTERVIPSVGTSYDLVREVHYVQGKGERYAYLVNLRPEVDAFYQDVYVFARQVPDEQLADLIVVIKKLPTMD